MRRAGVTPTELAERAGFGESLVYKWLRGDQAISAESLVRITEVLPVTADELLGVAAGQEPPFAAWRAFLETPEGHGVTQPERRTLQVVYWPDGIEPTVSSYLVALQAIRAGRRV